ncbi:MAG TPA: flagellar motor switch protein FliN [Gammaproteobacteria bacterium]|jgi:flagellar motor switch protein FliN/FliY|nr:flagellar motor switch protein FliN [Gammaproteobacteria bacterium]
MNDQTMPEATTEQADNQPLNMDPGTNNMGVVMDIPVTLAMELGRTRISIRELMNLKSGSVIELQKMTDEPMDVLVNGTLVARGEAVVVDDRFGIRLTDVVNPMDRVKNL